MPYHFSLVLRPPAKWLPGGIAAGAALLFALTGSVLAQTPPAGPPPAAAKVKLTFWNVEWFPGRRPNAYPPVQRRHVVAVAPVVARLDPDVLGLEEVADGAAAHLLTDGLPGGFRVDAVTDFHRENGEPTRQQTVLASRLPLIQAWTEAWKPGRDGAVPRRGFAFGAYQPSPGQVLLVYALHLKSNREDEPGGAATNYAMRAESSRQLLTHANMMAVAYAKMGNVTVVLGGDLNTSLDDPRFAAETTLRDLQQAGYNWAWASVPPAERVTLPGEGRYPDTTFDHIFFRGFGQPDGGGVRLLGASLEPTGRDCSDHRPVSATLELKGRNEG